MIKYHAKVRKAFILNNKSLMLKFVSTPVTFYMDPPKKFILNAIRL